MFEALIDAGPDQAPRAVVADKGYDSDTNRAMARQRGSVPVIPHRSNRKKIPARFARALYRGRARIEQMIGKLKRFKRLALRCEKTARNFRSIVALAAAFVLIKSVHTAQSLAGVLFDECRQIAGGQVHSLFLSTAVRAPRPKARCCGRCGRNGRKIPPIIGPEKFSHHDLVAV
jgi:transposase